MAGREGEEGEGGLRDIGKGEQVGERAHDEDLVRVRVTVRVRVRVRVGVSVRVGVRVRVRVRVRARFEREHDAYHAHAEGWHLQVVAGCTHRVAGWSSRRTYGCRLGLGAVVRGAELREAG